jgi:hypothetical protein
MSKKPKKTKAVIKASAFVSAVHASTPTALSANCNNGLGAIKGEHRTLLQFSNTRAVTGSLDYDKAMTAAGDKGEKWDYAVGYKAGAKNEHCIWVEVHPASTGEVKKMLGKLAALKAWLKADGKPLLELTPVEKNPFVWICTPAGVSIPGNGKERRALAQAGVRGPMKLLQLPLVY